jgi:hypothetical protein
VLVTRCACYARARRGVEAGEPAPASFAIYYYPAASGGLFLRGGLGWANLAVESTSSTGLGFVLGAGFDVRVSESMSLTPVLNFNWGEPEDGLSQNFYQLALGLTWH